ncbi:hypothetical protein K435DRAFT_793166 [Dendrothele bispora CBS 962.96]|uniref:Uncharacterized protein n=1 Tax=Dendrothele bispora (strain CBS 962.96) TaxID=1314807 RepID=A0A4S8MGR2_DENBC|nr:hypothetical protein K435DRAFT_793166 [Dendrothele bispora CBS 962.96]
MRADVDVNKLVGPILVGTWLNAMMYFLVLTQACYYFKTYSGERLLIKVTVLAALACDTLTTMAACASSYLATESLLKYNTGLSAALVQTFMLNRYWSLTRRKIVVVIIAGMILSSRSISSIFLSLLNRKL